MLNNTNDLEKSVSQVSERVKDNIFKSVILSYKDVKEIAEMIVDTSELKDTIKEIECRETACEFKRNVPAISYAKQSHSFQYCQNDFLEFCRMQYSHAIRNRLINYDMRFEDFFNFFALYAIYHEMTHVQQDKLYSNITNCNSNMTIVMNKSINFFDFPQNTNYFKSLIWRSSIKKKTRLYRGKYHSLFPIEREADINGLNLSVDVFEHLDIKKRMKLKYSFSPSFLVDGYQDDKCPLERISKFIGFDYNQDLINETQKRNNYYKMVYGLPVDRSLIREGISVIGDYNSSEQFVKKLTR